MFDLSLWIQAHPLATQVILAAACAAVVFLIVLRNRE